MLYNVFSLYVCMYVCTVCSHMNSYNYDVLLLLCYGMKGLRSKFGEVIPEKLAENGVLVNMHVCTTEDQAEYFFDVIAQLHDTAA